MEMSVEQLVEERRKVLMLCLVGTVLWQAGAILRHVLPHQENSGVLHLVETVGWVLFGWGMWRLTRLGKAMKGRPSVFAAFNDEWVEQNRLFAWRSAMSAMLILQGVWIATLALAPHLVQPLVVAETTLLVGTTVGIGAFLRRDAE